MLYERAEKMNTFDGGYFSPDYFYRKETERKALKKSGALCGLALLGYVLIQNVMALFVQAVGLWDKYTTDTFFQCGIDIFFTFGGVLLPFSLISRLMKKHTGISEPLIFERKVCIRSFLTAVMAGSGLCMAANVVSTAFIAFMSAFGITLSSPDVPMPSGSEGFLLSFVRVVVVAAMAEELALRGFVMGNLRKFGDSFAVGASAVLFAVMHGNLIQAPFALMAGFTIGYFTVKTGTLWTGVLIHGVNNFISLALSYMLELVGDEGGALLSAALIYGLGFIGIIATLVFNKKEKNIRFSAGNSILSPGEKISSFFINIPMILAFLLMLYITSNYVEFGR